MEPQLFAGVLLISVFLIILIGVASEKFDKLAWTLGWSIVAVLVANAFGLIGWGVDPTGNVPWLFDSIRAPNTFGLLLSIIGLSLVMALLSKSGIFQLLTLILLRKASFEQFLWLLPLLGLIFSLFLSNLLALIIVANLTVLVGKAAEINPEPLLFAELFAVNLGGMLTPISSYTGTFVQLTVGWSFLEFLLLGLPFVIPTFFISIMVTRLYYRDYFNQLKEKQLAAHLKDLLNAIDSRTFVEEKFLYKGIAIFGVVLLLLVFGTGSGLTIDIVTTFGAILVIISSPKESNGFIRDIDWTLLFFLSGVFLVSDLTSRSGIITFIFDPIISASSNLDPVSLLLFIGYFFGLATSFIENLPLLLLIQPVITGVAANPGFIVPQIGEYLSWWTILASVGITDSLMLVSSVKGIFLLSLLSNEGRKVGFVSYLKFGTLITFVQLFLMSIYIFFLFIILPLVVH